MGQVLSLSQLIQQRRAWKSSRKKVVFTNGVFDILHRGHAEYLAAAKSLGEVLVVAVNSDSSARKIKGPLRPVVNENDRAFLVAQLGPVDAVCIFDEKTPLEIISVLLPDVLVKGADWDVNDVIGKDIVERSGGKVLTVPLVPQRSTTGIIARIRELYAGQEKE
jgi:rfaE bifunctional protein nucleotidyltransferase chain/domain